MRQKTVKMVAPRMDLMRLMNGYADKRILLLLAPAGYGKTVSANLWLKQRETASTVLTLDEYDNHLPDFCKRFCGALLALQPDNAKLAEYGRHPAFDSAPVEFANHAIEAVAGDIRADLVLDDLHYVGNAEVLRFLSGAMARLPSGIKILILSRNEPPPAFRKAIADSVAVVEAGSFLFSAEEIRAYFASCGHAVSEEKANRIHQRTEGWAIGVNAVLLTGEGSPNRQLLRSHLGSFIRTQIWEDWDADTRLFMLKTALEDELTPSLCAALTGREDSGQFLERLVRENVFIEPCDGRAYRFHRLFRAFLEQQMEREGEAFRKRQLRLAGEWYLRRKDFYRAAMRFADCDDVDGIAKCFDFLEVMDRDGFVLDKLLPIIRRTLTSSVADTYPFLNYMMAYAALLEGRTADMARHADDYYRAYPKIIERNPDLAHNILFLRALDYRVTMHEMVQAVEEMPFRPEMRGVRGPASFAMPLYHRSFRDFSEYAVDDIGQGLRRLQDVVGNLLGDEQDMLVECIHAGLRYERGELQEALSIAVSANEKKRGHFAAETRFCGGMLLAHIHRALRNYDEARFVIQDMEGMIEREKLFILSDNFAAYKYRCDLEDGITESAEKWIAAYETDPLAPVTLYKLYGIFTTARSHISLGNYDKAIVILQKIYDMCSALGRPLDIIESKVLLAIAFWKKKRGYQREAVAHLEQAVIMASQYGYTQVFAGEGAELMNMLYRLQNRAIRKNYAGEVPGAFAKVLYMKAADQAKYAKGLTGGRASDKEKYTQQQKRVMRLLCEGYSYRQIAERLGIKFSTVRSHIELIYKKLDVPNETEAVLKIRELGILEE